MHRRYGNGVKFTNEVEKNMKNMKSRITAMLFAAATTVCASQAITANAWETFYYDTQTQDWCELPQNMGYTVRGWSRFNGISGGQYWNETVSSGNVCSTGYRRTTYSGTGLGTPLTGSQALCRHLANTFFGTQTYMEHIVYGSTPIKMGDQIRLGSTRNGSQKTIFITYVNSDGTFDAFSLNNSTHIIERNTYRKKSSTSYYLQRLNSNGTVVEDNIYMDFLIRPIKEGDVNGDGIFTQADKTWLKNKIGDQTNFYPKDVNALLNPSIYRTDIFARVVWANDYKVEYSAFYTVGWNLTHKDGVTGAVNDTGRMTFDGSGYFHYIKMNAEG